MSVRDLARARRTDAEEPIHDRADHQGAAGLGRRREAGRVGAAARDYRDDLYRWKKQYGGMQVNDARRLRALEEENRQLKRIVADQALNLQVVKDLLGKKR
jgi:hypothetical protein